MLESSSKRRLDQRGRLLLLIEGGRGGEKKWNVQFYFQPHNPPPLPFHHFLFLSAGAG